jgi:hypothetical protein
MTYQIDRRADVAEDALKLFIGLTGIDNEDALGDLLSDLMHLCDRTDAYGAFDEMLRCARMHYRDETAA